MRRIQGIKKDFHVIVGDIIGIGSHNSEVN